MQTKERWFLSRVPNKNNMAVGWRHKRADLVWQVVAAWSEDSKHARAQP
jgi:hypothetical protein